MKKYIYASIDEPRGAAEGEIFDSYFPSLKEANENAREAWKYLRPSEKKQRHIYVCKILLSDYLSENGWTDADILRGYFDSEKIKNK